MIKKSSRRIAVALFALFLIAHADGAHVPASAAMASKTARSCNDLGIQFYLILSSADNNNVVFSPFGLTMVVGKTIKTGSQAGRKTFEKLDEVLELNSRKFFKDMKKLKQEIVDKRNDGIHLEFENIILGKEDELKMRDGNTNYKLQTHQEKPRGRQNTMSVKLKKILRDFENVKAKITLVNKAVFTAHWEIPFSIFTRSSFFIPGHNDKRIPDKEVQVDYMGLMSDEYQFNYFDDGEYRCQVVELNYGKDFVGDSWDPRYSPADVSMVIALPYKDQPLRTLEEQLSPGIIDRWAYNLKLINIEVTIPKFNNSILLDASVPLQELGLHSLFSDPSHKPARKGKLRSLWQEISIAASEIGTKKPRVPSEDVSIMLISNPKKKLKADRPFLFFVRDKTTNTILFMGRVVNPNQS